MFSEILLKNKLLSAVGSILIVIIGYFFKEPLFSLLTNKVEMPIYVLFALPIITIILLFAWRWYIIISDKSLRAIKNILKPGSVVGINNGPANVIILEWSWLAPDVAICQTKDGHTLRVHRSLIILYL